MSEFTDLKERCFQANMDIPRHALAVHTWGNVSAYDSQRQVFAIKPSGVSYGELRPNHMVVVNLDNQVVDGALKPSSDTRTHSVLYRKFAGIGGIVHTHSPYAVGWAQAIRPIPIYGTTHADHTTFDIPCTPPMAEEQIRGDYEEETGNQIVAHFSALGLNPQEVEMVLVGCHGPFAWGTTVEKAVYNAVSLEEIAKMAAITVGINARANRLPDALRDKHYQRKHGADAYYGQE